MTNFVWAAAALGGLDAASLNALTAPVAGALAGVGAEGLHQLWQAGRLVGDAGGGRAGGDDAAAPPPLLPPVLVAPAVAARIASSMARVRASGFGNAVYAAAAAAPRAASAAPEAALAGGLHRVDVAVVTLSGTRVALEADGPLHFLASHPRVAGGATAVRDALVARDGWAPVPVPYWEWDELGGDADAQVAYIDAKLAAADERAAAAGGGARAAGAPL